MICNAPLLSIVVCTIIVVVVASWFASLSTPSHFVVEGCCIFVPFFLSLTVFAVVLEILGNSMGPAVGNWGSVVVVSLRNEWCTVAISIVVTGIVVVSVIVVVVICCEHG